MTLITPFSVVIVSNMPNLGVPVCCSSGWGEAEAQGTMPPSTTSFMKEQRETEQAELVRQG